MGYAARTLAERFWEKVDKNGPVHPDLGHCWVWTAYRLSFGYGLVGAPPGRIPRTLRAHRVAWELVIGPIPAGAFVLHECDNPSCVRPAHLVLGSQMDNVRHQIERGRHGHGRLKGEECGHSILNASDVLEIRERAAAGERQVDLAQAFSTSQAHISQIVRGLQWRSLLDAEELRRLDAKPRRSRRPRSESIPAPSPQH